MQTAINPRRWWALVVLAFAQFITIMDTSIIGVALPDIQEALAFSPEGLSWVFNAYVIAFGGLLLLGGKLGDLFGARNVFATGLVVLTAGSLAAEQRCELVTRLAYIESRLVATGVRSGLERDRRSDRASPAARAASWAAPAR